jgi:tryptophanyl-tRNA synthetase
MKTDKRVLSGMRPTGLLHLGHFYGVLQEWLRLQEKYECFFFVADWHAITDSLDTERLAEYTDQMVIDWLSAGIDPARTTIFVQSHVPYHAELHLLLSMVTPLAWVERCPTFKDKIKDLKGENITYGLLGYPVLQTSDIALYKATDVPIGEDQLAHLELSREIVRRFNFIFSPVFPEPKPILSKTPKLLGLDGRKMSKSYDNCIYLSEEPAAAKKKILEMFTDPKRIYRKDKGNPGVCNVFSCHGIFNSANIKDIENECMDAARGCKECKKELGELVEKFLIDFQKKRKAFEDRVLIRDILKKGTEKAISEAEKTIAEVKKAIKFVS